MKTENIIADKLCKFALRIVRAYLLIIYIKSTNNNLNPYNS